MSFEKLYEIDNNTIVIAYDRFVDYQKCYLTNNFKEECVTAFKQMHSAIINNIESASVVFGSRKLSNEEEYREFLSENKESFKGYIEILEKRSNYSINEA